MSETIDPFDPAQPSEDYFEDHPEDEELFRALVGGEWEEEPDDGKGVDG